MFSRIISYNTRGKNIDLKKIGSFFLSPINGIRNMPQNEMPNVLPEHNKAN
jgi:hypothetical protein